MSGAGTDRVCLRKEKTTVASGGLFGFKELLTSLGTKVTGFRGAQSPKLSFQCSLNWLATSRTPLDTPRTVTNGYRHWRFVVSVRVGLKSLLPYMAW